MQPAKARLLTERLCLHQSDDLFAQATRDTHVQVSLLPGLLDQFVRGINDGHECKVSKERRSG